MAFLKRRGGYYYICYEEGTGKDRQQQRFSTKTKDRRVAKDKLRAWEDQHERPGGPLLLTETPVAEVLEAYVQHLKTSKSSRYVQDTIWVLREAFGEVCDALKPGDELPVGPAKHAKNASLARRRAEGKFYKTINVRIFEHIGTSHVSEWMRTMVLKRGWGAVTAKNKRAVLSALWKWALGAHGLRRTPDDEQVNPIEKVPTYKAPAPQIRHLNLVQIGEQLEALDPGEDKEEQNDTTKRVNQTKRQVRTMVATYIYAGLRLAECLHLTLDDVELGDGVKSFGMIRIVAKDFVGGRWQPKTAGNRLVPISSSLYPILKAYQPRLVPGRWFFPSPAGLLWSVHNFSRRLNELNKAAGLEWTCLDFRHTFGSHLAMKGEALHKIAKLMGNSPEVVRKHYAHLIPEEMTDTVEFRKTKQA